MVAYGRGASLECPSALCACPSQSLPQKAINQLLQHRHFLVEPELKSRHLAIIRKLRIQSSSRRPDFDYGFGFYLAAILINAEGILEQVVRISNVTVIDIEFCDQLDLGFLHGGTETGASSGALTASA